MARSTVLPDTLPPRLIGRLAAADFVGISPTKFDEMVNDGRMPRPKCIDRRKLWDVRSLNAKVDELPDDEPSKPERKIML